MNQTLKEYIDDIIYIILSERKKMLDLKEKNINKMIKMNEKEEEITYRIYQYNEQVQNNDNEKENDFFENEITVLKEELKEIVEETDKLEIINNNIDFFRNSMRKKVFEYQEYQKKHKNKLDSQIFILDIKFDIEDINVEITDFYRRIKNY